MVKDVRQTFDKRGQTMAFLELEDLEGTVQGVLFSSVFEKYGRYLAPQAHVFLVARADVQRDRTSMPAEEVVPMRPGEASQESRRSRTSILVEEVVPMVDAPRRFCEAICIRLGRRADEQSALQKLRHTMAAHRGECPVLIEVPSGHGGVSTVKVSRDLYVSPTQEFLSEVEGLVGKGCVRSVAARNLAASAEEP
jgi:DNA polymerase-3 subunit alpha